MQTFTKTLIGTAAAGAMAVSAAAPAQARDRGGIDAGDVIAGAVVIGGIAAIAAAASNNDRDRYRYDNPWDRRYDRRDNRRGRYDYRRGVNPRSAIQQCVAAATRTANRYSYGGRARVTDIRDVDRKRYGYKIKGRIAVNTMGRHWRSGDRHYGRGWDNDHRGWNRSVRGYDSGRFTCKVDYRGRVADLDFKGIRGL